MQPPTAAPRDGLTAAAVTALIRDAPSVVVSAGCELVAMDLTVVDDVTDALVSGSITRESYATLHGSARLGLEVALDWGSAIVRPYMVLTAGTTTARFNLGAYYTSVQGFDAADDPVVYDVECLDILDGLNSPVGETFAVDVGVSYLATVEDILRAQGYTVFLIDQARADAVLPSARVWPMDENTTWLTVVNDLLGSIGYAGVWSDWDGRLRVQPYVSPSDRPAEWAHDADVATSMLTPQRRTESDNYRAPNRWVFYRSNGLDGPTPVEGNGIFTVVNQSNGPTSVDARGGRVISKPVPLDVADHAALVAASRVTVDADMRRKTTYRLGTAPNPLHWHFDRLSVNDPALGPPAEVLASTWTLPLDGADMTHDWTVL